MKTYVEITENIIRRTNEYQVAQKKKRRIMISTATSFCCLCLVVLMGFGIWNSGILNNTPNDGEEIAYPDIEINGESNLPDKDTPPKVDTDPVDDPDDLPVITPPSDDEPDNEPTTSGGGRISVVVADDYVVYTNSQKQLNLYDLATGKTVKTDKIAANGIAAGKYVFYQTDDGIYEYFSNRKVCDVEYYCVAYDESNVLFTDNKNGLYIWQGDSLVFIGKIEGSNSVYGYTLKNNTAYAQCKDLNSGENYVAAIKNGAVTKNKADDYAIIGEELYTLKNGNVYKGDALFINDGNIISLDGTDFGIYTLKNIDATHLILTCYDLNGNVTDTIENVSSVKEYNETIGVKFSVDNQNYAATITQDGIKKYAVDSLFLEVKCNEKCLVAPGVNSFDIVIFETGKQLTIDGR